MAARNFLWQQPAVTIVVVSVILHASFLSSLGLISHRPLTNGPRKIRVSIVEPETPKVEAIPEPTAIPRPTPKDKTKEPLPASQVKAKEPPKANVAPVQGLSKEALDNPTSTSKFVAPAGNTLMVEDQGKRLRPDQIQALNSDLSADAKLIQGSFTQPEYTQDALDANLEGTFVMEVYVDEKGNVLDAQLKKKIGYGMDEKVVKIAKSARFIPRKNSVGSSIAGWSDVRFTLTIP